MIEQCDTGDWVIHKRTNESYMVACCHGFSVHVWGAPERVFRLADLNVLSRATPEQRIEHLKALAGSSGSGHRPACARSRLDDLAAGDG